MREWRPLFYYCVVQISFLNFRGVQDVLDVDHALDVDRAHRVLDVDHGHHVDEDLCRHALDVDRGHRVVDVLDVLALHSLLVSLSKPWLRDGVYRSSPQSQGV